MNMTRRLALQRTRRQLLAKKIGSYETLEARQVMANDFLAGTAFIDTNNNGQLDIDENYLPGATIELRSADGSTLLATRITDNNGAYTFKDVSPGDYTILNRSADNYASSAAQAITGISTVASTTANSIKVTLRSPSNLQASVDMDRFINGIAAFEEVQVSIEGTSLTRRIGQLPAQLLGNTLSLSPTAEFLTLSSDLYHGLGAGVNGPYDVNASLKPIGSGDPHNAGRIAYLFNHYGAEQLGAADAVGLQLAVWELLYDAEDSLGDLTDGDFRVTSASSDAKLAARLYLADSLQKSEVAIFLNADGQPDQPIIDRTQSLITGGSFNFANVPAAKIGDTVWHDKNVNGRQEGNEPRIPGATVKLYQGATLIDTTTTNADGLYEFDHLLAGTYKVEFVLPAGFTQISPANIQSNNVDSEDSDGPIVDSIVLTAGQKNDTIDQGFYNLASLGDFVWNDRNGNGFQAAGEEGIEGAKVKLFREGNLVDTATTNSQGFYKFSNLQPGVYDVEFLKPDGYSFISPQGQEAGQFDSDGPFVSELNLESGENETTVDQGFYGSAKIGNFVWHDLNADGIQDSNEPGIDGVTVELLQGSTVVATTTTAGGGLYSFSVAPGTYKVRFTKPGNFANVSPTDATSDELDSDGLLTAAVTVGSEGTFNFLDVGFYNPATIGNYVWHDLDADGFQDADEPGINGVTVTLFRGTTEIASTVTTGGGLYSFVVTPGNYTVKFTKPIDYSSASPIDAASDDRDSDGPDANVSILSGGINNNIDQGFYKLVKIGNFVWNDLDADGVQDADEGGIDGVTVSLRQGSTEVASTITAGGGLYSFVVVPGTYRIMFTKPLGYSRTSPANATSDDLDSDDLDTDPFTVISGDTNSTLDQGFYNLAKIGNLVWHDLNADGILGANEPGIDGVQVSLMQGATEVATTTTAGGGFYSFSVMPGTYSVKFTKPADYSNVSPTDATTDDLDSDGLITPAVTVVSDQHNQSLDLGLFNLTTLGNFVWHDLNADGIQDGNEPGIDGVAVSLLQGTTEVATTTTAGGGFYSFSVVPGTYSVRFTKPTTYTNVSPTDATNDDLDSDGLTPAAVTLTSGQTNSSIDLGCSIWSRSATLSGMT